MLAELPTWLTDAGTIAGVIIATAAVLGLVARARPVRWLWRQLVSDPIGGWASGVVSAQVDPVRSDIADVRDSLTSTDASVSSLAEQLVNHMGAEEQLRTEDMADRERRHAALDAWRAEMLETMATKDDIRGVHQRVDDALAALAAGNPEVRRATE